MAQKLIRCEAGHIYDSAAHTTCPECGESPEVAADDRPRQTQPPTGPVVADSGGRDSKKKEPSKTGLWMGIAGAVLALAAGGGYFLLQSGSRDEAIGDKPPRTTSTPKAVAAKSDRTQPGQKKTGTTQARNTDARPSPRPSEASKQEKPGITVRETPTGDWVVEDPSEEKPGKEQVAPGEDRKATPPDGTNKRTDAPPSVAEGATHAAAEGDAEAQYQQGLAYETGRGVAKDPVQAAAWFRKAAEQGHAGAEYRLGISYQLGRGVNRDYAEAAKWYQRSAQHGLPEAQNDLGALYVRGQGVARDYELAARWYRKAADQGYAMAQKNLGDLYSSGRGVPKDSAEAVKFYTAAAGQGYTGAQYRLGKMYETGEGVRQDHAEAVKWLGEAAEQGHENAQNDLGVLYWKGLGVDRNLEVAAAWFRKAAEQGFVIAQANTGDMYHRGQGVEKNPYEALKWYRSAVKNGYTMKKNQLGKAGLSFKTSSQLECNGIGLELELNASWNGQEQSCKLGAARAFAGSGCAGAVGTWIWSSRGTVTISGNGTMNHTPGPGSFVPIGAGQWTCSGANRIVLKWDGGQFVDHLTLSRDGNRLSGRNNVGWPVTGTKQHAQSSSGAQPPAGILSPPQHRTRQ